MKQVGEPEELIARWTLVEGDWGLLGNKTGATRLGFVIWCSKYIEIEGEFPRYGEQVPPAAVEFVAGLVKVDPAKFAKYSFDNRTAEYHRARVREALGFRPAIKEDISGGWRGWPLTSARWSRIGDGCGLPCGDAAAAKESSRRWMPTSSAWSTRPRGNQVAGAVRIGGPSILRAADDPRSPSSAALWGRASVQAPNSPPATAAVSTTAVSTTAVSTTAVSTTAVSTATVMSAGVCGCVVVVAGAGRGRGVARCGVI